MLESQSLKNDSERLTWKVEREALTASHPERLEQELWSLLGLAASEAFSSGGFEVGLKMMKAPHVGRNVVSNQIDGIKLIYLIIIVVRSVVLMRK